MIPIDSITGLESVDPRQAAWALGLRGKSKVLSEREVLGLYLYDLLITLKYADNISLFIVTTTLDWAYKQITEGSAAVVQILDQEYVAVMDTGPEPKFSVWSLKEMEQVDGQVRSPLVSVGLSATKLYHDFVKPLFEATTANDL